MRVYRNLFSSLASPETLFAAWDAFRIGKQQRHDVRIFSRNLEEHLFALHHALAEKTYSHGPYHLRLLHDPKLREIHSASVGDRVVHHALFLILNPLFEKTFFYDTYSCRINKGTHRGINRLTWMIRRMSKNGRRECFMLKCDIKKFFASVDHGILFARIKRTIDDPNALWLIRTIIESFAPGIPIGNLTSQLFANIYMHALDQFVKQTLRVPYYIRYTDDFVLVHENPEQLKQWLSLIQKFLADRLHLTLHPNKITLRKYHHGIDFLGYVQHPSHRTVRHTTLRRMLKKVAAGVPEAALHSYLGVLSHANARRRAQEMKHLFWLTSKQQ